MSREAPVRFREGLGVKSPRATRLVVLSNGTKGQADALREGLQEFLSEELRLTLSMEKTKVTHLNDGFTFLGFQLKRGPAMKGGW
jgi:RNA-directed DNA polymerase